MENLKTMAKVRLTMIVYRWNIAFNNAVLRLRIFRIKIIVSRVIDTGAGYLIKSVEKKAKQRRFYKEKEQDEEYCQDCNLTFSFMFQSFRLVSMKVILLSFSLFKIRSKVYFSKAGLVDTASSYDAQGSRFEPC